MDLFTQGVLEILGAIAMILAIIILLRPKDKDGNHAGED